MLKENTQELIQRAYYVTGLAEQVDLAVEGLECHHAEKMGRSKGVTVLLNANQEIPTTFDITVQPISLQKLFVALCGEEVHG